MTTATKPTKLPLGSYTALWQAWRASWQPFWAQRDARERRLLAGTAPLLFAALLYKLAWEPADEGRAKLQAELPGLRAQWTEMQALAQEATNLGTATLQTLGGGALQDTLTRELAAKGIGPTRLTVIGETPLTVQLHIDDAAFGAWMDWLEEVRIRYRLKVSEASIGYVDAPARVRMVATLQGPRP